MSHVKYELEPGAAAVRAFEALLEAGRYSGYGLAGAGTRAGRRAIVAGAEGGRRSRRAWSELRGVRQVPPRRTSGIVVLAVAAGGAAAALAVQQAIVSWRTPDSLAKRVVRRPGTDPQG